MRPGPEHLDGGVVMKSSDIPDEHVIELARAWHDDHTQPCVADALIAEGVPAKLAYAKIEKLVGRGLLNYGVSPRCAWPEDA
jgi:hypothetical protein